MIEKLYKIKPMVGQTPTVLLMDSPYHLHAKLEGYNYTGSAKARPAYHIIEHGLKNNLINKDTLLVESSSGNFAIALASICKVLGLKFTAVIDKNTSADNERVLRVLCYDVVKIMEPDETGGYLLNRIKKVKSFVAENANSFWPNQYANKLNAEAHYLGTGAELCEQVPNLDYVFIAVSSGGTITGISQRVKDTFPKAKVIAVDAEGSVIFGAKPRPRPIPGMGSSMRPPILDNAHIDEVVYVSEAETITGCHRLLNRHGLFLGGSSGAVYTGANRYLRKIKAKQVSAAIICPDMGNPYLGNIYNKAWADKYLNQGENLYNRPMS